MLLIEAQKYLEVVRKRGEAGSELRRVYSNIATTKELFLAAYAHLSGNKGALTPGIDPDDTIDGMSIHKIDVMMATLQRREYVWKPVRRTYRLKRDGKTKRPLGMPGWNDKLLQEVIKMVLEAYYEPQFRDSSHGFRPHRGCHTALHTIKEKWTNVRWFIEGDIKGCFDNLDWNVILGVLRRQIKDTTFLHLIQGMLAAGYAEDWTYHQTYSGTPQGGIVSPLLANIVLNELDTFVEDILIPKYTRGKARARNPEYDTLASRAYQAKKKGDYKTYKAIQKVQKITPSRMPNDPDFRRLKYLRYADDTLMGYNGTRREAEAVKQEFGQFIQSIRLDMSEEKTLITHALTERAKFLNYEIGIMWNDRWRTGGRRSANGQIQFSIPKDVITTWKQKVKGHKYEMQERPELMNLSDFDIIAHYETELQGLIEYYALAHNTIVEMTHLRDLFKGSLVKTLAAKYKTNVTKIYRKYTMINADGKKVIAVKIPREGKKPLVAAFGRKPIRRKRHANLNDTIQTIYVTRNELLERLLAEHCELCGKEGHVEGHHIKKLKDLKTRWAGRKEKPEWVTRMIAMRRKTLFVCDECHKKIHHGTYDGAKIT